MEAIYITLITLCFIGLALAILKALLNWRKRRKQALSRESMSFLRFTRKSKHLSELREKYKALVLKGEDNDNLLSEIVRLDKELKDVCRKWKAEQHP